jgi:maltose alpha-D-glucosyltransferase/alpha-amylase
MRKFVDDYSLDTLLLSEANQWPEDVIEYFGDGDEMHMNFHFPLMPRLFMALAKADRTPIEEILLARPFCRKAVSGGASCAAMTS